MSDEKAAAPSAAHAVSQRHHARLNGVRDAITWLHAHAAGMNDPHAKAILNAAAFALGVELS